MAKSGPPVLEVTLKEAKRLLKMIFKAKITPQLVSSPGLGKSAIMQEIADEWNLLLIDIRLTEYDPTEMNGFPFILNPNDDPSKVKAGHVPLTTFPIEGDELPINPKTGKPYSGWLILLDEFPSAPLSVQAAAYKVTLDRMVGNHKLHKKVLIATAGNKATDKAIVNRLSTAQQSRLITLMVKNCTKTWLEWAERENIDYRVRSFIRFKPDQVHQFDPNHADLTFPCPRTWHFMSRLLIANKIEEVEHYMLPMFAGTVGHGAARLFFSFCEVYGRMPTIKEMIADPEGCQLPNEISVQHAAAGLVAHHINKKNASQLIRFLDRLPADLQTVTLRNSILRDDELRSNQDILKWAANNTKELIV